MRLELDPFDDRERLLTSIIYYLLTIAIFGFALAGGFCQWPWCG